MVPDTDIGAMLNHFPGPVRLTPSRRKWVLILVVCLVFFAGGVWMLAEDAAGWAAVGVFGLIALFAGVMLLFPGAGGLALDAEGFEITMLGTRTRTRWADASGFEGIGLIRRILLRRTAPVVYDDARMGKTFLRASLPEAYGLRPQDLARLMNLWRERAVGTRV